MLKTRPLGVPTKVLQAVVVLIGIAALVFLLGEPLLEGRNAHATLFEVYFKDPFLAYVYAGSAPFFWGLRHAFKALGYVGQGKASSPETAEALRRITLCAAGVIGFVVFGELCLMALPSDDRAGGVFMGALITFGAVVVAAAATMFERICRNAAG